MPWFCVEKIFLLLLLIRCSTGLSRDKFVIQPHPVQFNEDPHNWTVTIGASVSLTCNTTVVQVIGYINEDITPLPQIRWFHNNVMISNTSNDHFTINSYGIDTSILTITNVTLLEQGEYHCVVNEWVKPNGDWWTKTRSRSGYITVIDNSSIVTVNSEENVVLSCVEPTALVPSSRVVWIKHGEAMNETVTDHNGNLILAKVTEDNNGHYKCIDHVNNTTLLSYTVTINNATSKYLQQHALQLLMENVTLENHFINIRSDADITGCRDSPKNQSVTLNCKASGYLSINWYKNGEVLDVDSEGSTFNQTTGDLIIRRKDACELLGVYQCFASNEIDTVQVSTRVLPFGWPNQLGRPQFVNIHRHGRIYELGVKLNPPDYMGGLTEEMDLRYDIRLADSGIFNTSYFITSIDPSNINEYVSIQLLKDFIIGLEHLHNVYYLIMQMSVTSKNSGLAEIIALPRDSPHLRVDTLCAFIDDPPLPVIKDTCEYDNISDLVVHNISWNVEFVTDEVKRVLFFKVWYIVGGCTYPNGTIADQWFADHLLYRDHYTWKLPRNSTCNLSATYETRCGSAKSYLNNQCNYNRFKSIAGTFDQDQKKENIGRIIGAFCLAAVLTIMSIVTYTLYLCYRKYSHRKQSALKMLRNVTEINELKASCPISVGQQSVFEFETKSELYVEKVNRWIENIAEVPPSDVDTDSFLESCSLSPSVMLGQIVEGKVTKSSNLTLTQHCACLHHNTCCNSTSLPTPCGECSINRLQSAYFKMGSNFSHSTETDGSSKYCELLPDRAKVRLTATGYNGSNDMVLECHDLQGNVNCNSDHIGSTRPVVNTAVVNQDHNCSSQSTTHGSDQDYCSSKSTEQFNYVGLDVFHQDHCLSKSIEHEVDQDHCISKQFNYDGLEVAQDHCLSKSIGHAVDQDHCISKSIEQLHHVGLEVVNQDDCLSRSTAHESDQDHCISKKIKQFDYVGLEVAHQDHCWSKSMGHVVDQDHCTSKSTEQFDYVGLEVAQDHCWSKSMGHVVDQDHCTSKSTEQFDYVGLEVAQDHCWSKSMGHVVDQDHCISKSTEEFIYVGLEVAQDHCWSKSMGHVVDQDHCISKSTEEFVYVGLEVVDQDERFPISTEQYGDSAKLEVIDQDQCIRKSVDTHFILINQGHHRPSSTVKDSDISDQYCCVPRSTETFNNYTRLPVVDHNSETGCQDRLEVSLDSNSGWHNKPSDEVVCESQDCHLQFNNDGYVTSPALTGQYGHIELVSPTELQHTL